MRAYHYLFVVFLFCSWTINLVGSSPDQAPTSSLNQNIENTNSKFLGCLPCSQPHLFSSYFQHQDSLLDSDFDSFLNAKFGPDEFCKYSIDSDYPLQPPELHRELIGEGSHRLLTSNLRFIKPTNDKLWLDRYCEVIIIERLPNGVFADPFELQHLVERKVFLDAIVFGDANLELPSALSNRSLVEIHLDLWNDAHLNQYETVLHLPLHSRYPPLDVSGYREVLIGRPHVFLRCRPKALQQEPCWWTYRRFDSGSSNDVIWQVPCGSPLHTGVVSKATFASALVCSLSIVWSAVQFSRKLKADDNLTIFFVRVSRL